MTHPALAALTDVADPPRSVVLETVSTCNLRCPSCAVGTGMFRRRKGGKLMAWDLFTRLADEIEPYAKHVYLHLWGEPTLHPRLGEMIRRVKRFATVDIATHGMFVTETLAADIALADTISVSIEGTTQEVYERYRVGGVLADAMRGLRLLALAAHGLVNWTWIGWAWNEHQIPEAREIARDLGVNLGVKPAYVLDDSQAAVLPSDAQPSRYVLQGAGKAPVLTSDRHGCREFWEVAYVLSDGDVATCCYDLRAEWIVGDVRGGKTLASVWNGEPYRAMRRRHLSGELNALCARDCKLP